MGDAKETVSRAEAMLSVLILSPQASRAAMAARAPLWHYKGKAVFVGRRQDRQDCKGFACAYASV